MTKSVDDLPFTARERLRWRRAMDAHLVDAIFAQTVRDGARLPPAAALPPRNPSMVAPARP